MKFEKGSIKRDLSRYTIYFVLLGLVILMSALSRNFFTYTNITNIFVLESARAIMTIGMGLVMITKGIDLSVASVAALASVISGSLVQEMAYSGRLFSGLGYVPAWAALLAGLAVGLLIGILNGWLVAYIKLPPFIATLGTTTIAVGVAYSYTNSFPVPNLRGDFKIIAQASIGNVPVIIIYVAVLAVIAWIILNKTRLGKRIYAIGGSESAARVSGINIEKTKMTVYIISSVLAAFAGILLAGRSGAGNSILAKGYELDAISAAAIGGVSMNGGIGTLGGMMIGMLILGVLNNGMLLLGISPYYQMILKGIIILIAVTIDLRRTLRTN